MDKTFPDEILNEVYGYLGAVSRTVTRQVCKRFYELFPRSVIPMTPQVWNESLTRWMIENGCRHSSICMHALTNGQIELAKFAMSRGCKFRNEFFTLTTVVDNFELLDWIHRNVKTIPLYFYVTLVARGKLETLKYLHRINYLTTRVCEMAICFNRQDILEWSIEVFKITEAFSC